jgi:uncharacterized protein
MTATPFTPVASTIGGIFIVIAAVILLLFNGRIAGISGILGRLLPPYVGTDPPGALTFVLGLVAAPFVYAAFFAAQHSSALSALRYGLPGMGYRAQVLDLGASFWERSLRRKF